MLLGQKLGGGHQRALKTGGGGGEQRGQGHHRLTAANLALEQPVHRRRAPFHVLGNLGNAAGLRSGQLKGQGAQENSPPRPQPA